MSTNESFLRDAPSAQGDGFALFRDMIVTARPDGTIPLNSRVVATSIEVVAPSLLNLLIERANAALADEELVESLGAEAEATCANLEEMEQRAIHAEVDTELLRRALAELLEASEIDGRDIPARDAILADAHHRARNALSHLEGAQSTGAIMVEALRQIADDHKTYKGHGDYDEGPMSGDEAQKIARAALSLAKGDR